MGWTRQGLEDEVVELLQPMRAPPFNYNVLAWPDREMQAPAMDRSLLVAITDESWQPPQTYDAIDQAGELSVEIQAVQRSRRGPQGQLDLRDEVQKLLTRDIPGAGRCYLQDAGLLPRESSVWKYAMSFVLEINRSEMET